ncbi:MAG: MOSC N-terminal beta barrel domain-containing protein [Burkholderiaceae bacterium]
MTEPSSAYDVNGQIARLFVYPIKSCAGVEVRESALTETGLDLDRAWMVVDEEGVFVTQRELPSMALIRAQLRTYEVILRAPGMLPLHLQVDQAELPVQVRVWNDTLGAYSMGDLAAQWFSDFLAQQTSSARARPYRLVRFDPEQRRLANMQWTAGVEAQTQFVDGFPLLVASQASLDGLNQRLQAQGLAPVGMERFRPNIVLSGVEEHDEDRMDEYRIDTQQGPVVLRPVKPCVRCPIPNIDPQTAVVTPEVGDMLQTYRQDPRMQGGITFAMNAIVIEGLDSVLKVGQTVRGNLCFEA